MAFLQKSGLRATFRNLIRCRQIMQICVFQQEVQVVVENEAPRIAQLALEIFAVAKITAKVFRKQGINPCEKVLDCVNADLLVRAKPPCLSILVVSFSGFAAEL